MHAYCYYILLSVVFCSLLLSSAATHHRDLSVNAGVAQHSLSMQTMDEQRYQAAPPHLNLEQVHVYVRHGERTPVGIRMNESPAKIPAFWNLCNTARRFRATVLGNDNVPDSIDIIRLSERGDGKANEGECQLGELTDLGRESTLKFGQNLRKLYVERLGFLPDMLESHEVAYFRSTNMPRTIETLQQVLYGLYPTSKISKGFVPYVRTRYLKGENLVGNVVECARLAELARHFSKAAAAHQNPRLEQFDSKLSKFINGNPIRIDGHPRLSGIMDTIRAASAHGIRVPSEFHNKSTVDALETAICDEWFRGYKDHEFRRLAMGRLLSEMSDQMTGVVNGTNGAKIRVNSCHDTTLAGLCTTLDVFDNRWPDFTASVTFEMFRESDSAPPNQSMFSLGIFARTPPAQRFVRMRYQNRNLALPACAAPGDHLSGSPEFCTLAAFQKHVRTLTPDDWHSECMVKDRGKP